MLLAFVLAVALADTSQAQPEQEAAKVWVQLLDARQWDQSWKATGRVFQSRVPLSRWVTTIRPIREAFGQVVSRSLAQATSTHTLPAVPDGDYEVLQYRTAFANKASATETMVLAREDGRWVIEGYFVR